MTFIAKLTSFALALALVTSATTARAETPSETERLMRATGERARGQAQRAVVKSFALIDRKDGGVRAENGGEKTAADQAVRLRLFAMAWNEWKGTSFEKAARDVDSYVERALTSEDGAIYSSESRPAISARDNGAMIVALTAMHAASGEASKLDRALKAARFIESNLKAADGSYGSEEGTLAMAAAAIALFESTGKVEWRDEASQLVRIASVKYTKIASK